MNPLRELQRHGQAVWLDYIQRSLIQSGELKRLVEEDGLRGVTSNPTIFEKAIGGSTDYDSALRAAIAKERGIETGKLYEGLAIADIRAAADILRPVYDETDGADGFVSLEVSPHLAHDAPGTIAEAKRLRAAVDRPNVMIKVPATPEGIPAVESLIGDGVNVNITLMFSMGHYEAVARAYIRGLERCAEPHRVASVASFFVSRVDTMVDKALEKRDAPEARALCGKIAVANSKLVYRRFQEIFRGEGFARLRGRGARVQRPLWASTSTKNPEYPDVLYVETLIGADTVNTMPPETLEAFRDHGRVPGETVTERLGEAEETLSALERLGIDLDAVAEQLQRDGVASFAKSFDQLMAALEKKRSSLTGVKAPRQVLSLGKYQRRVDRRLRKWRQEGFSSRLWQKDATLWSSEPVAEITDRLGWLALPESMAAETENLCAFADQVKQEGFRHVVLLGMGGSSLAPELFQKTFGNAGGYPELRVLDSTHPAALRSLEARVALERTLFLVSSKSGTTTETNAFFYYFWDRLSRMTGEPGRHFVAITDPGTPLEKLAGERGFRAVFQAPVDVGGRYSALTVFGLVPAALIGVDVGEILGRARAMSAACGAGRAEPDNPALALGAALGELALAKRDKVTFVASSSLAAFPSWVEQLIAESTGKERKGIVPVAGETLGPPEEYGADRFFVCLKLSGEQDGDSERRLAALEGAGHPVARIELGDKINLGGEFFRWEMAVAAAGAALGIHPFNQPDVQLAKDLAKRAMEKKTRGRKPGARRGAEVSAAEPEALERALSAWLGKRKARDYVAIQAYLSPAPEHTAALQAIATALRTRLKAASTVGYGPRFLHSTGQLHKGGPNAVLVLQIVDEPAQDLAVPETGYTFGSLIRAQALGDFSALKQRRRRILRVNLGSDPAAGLARLEQALSESGRRKSDDR